MTDPRLERWLEAVTRARGLTALRGEDARRVLLEDALRGAEVVRAFGGPLVDVGSGGGTPGIPLAAALPDVEVTLLEAEARKAAFLERWAREFPNVRVIHGRAEEHLPHCYRVATAKALAPPPVAAEWCLPLVREGGAAVLWVGASADVDAVARVCERLNAAPPEEHEGLLVLRKLGLTPPGFPRRPGMARKRPLA